MEISIYGVFTDQTARPDEVAALVEAAGFAALTVGEHTHMPAAQAAEAFEGDTPPDYARLYDLWIAMTMAAMATTTLRVSAAIIQLAHRDPLITAKEAATLDLISGGLLDLVIGHGWGGEQMRNHGVDPDTRYAVVRERILAMKELFAHDVASFHGDYVNFDAVHSWPKPVQPGGVPLILGGFAPETEARVLEYADGWAPILMGDDALNRIRRFADANPGVPIHASGGQNDPAEIERCAAAGVTRLMLTLGPVRDLGTVEGALEEIRDMVAVAVG
jgi:probable F420-dependent oxidoreductase